jgi:hypothetical protein
MTFSRGDVVKVRSDILSSVHGLSAVVIKVRPGNDCDLRITVKIKEMGLNERWVMRPNELETVDNPFDA